MTEAVAYSILRLRALRDELAVATSDLADAGQVAYGSIGTEVDDLVKRLSAALAEVDSIRSSLSAALSRGGN